MSTAARARGAHDGFSVDVMLITDAHAAARHGGVLSGLAKIVDVIDDAVAARIAVVVRDKAADAGAFADLVAGVAALCRPRGVRVLVHTHQALLPTLGLGGLHLDARTPVAGVRAQLPAGAWLGASRHQGDALTDDVDYVFLSPVFHAHSKPAGTALGLSALSQHVQRAAVPVVALGGIDIDTAGACIEAGASAVAVVGAVWQSTSPARAVTELVRAVRMHRA